MFGRQLYISVQAPRPIEIEIDSFDSFVVFTAVLLHKHYSRHSAIQSYSLIFLDTEISLHVQVPRSSQAVEAKQTRFDSWRDRKCISMLFRFYFTNDRRTVSKQYFQTSTNKSIEIGKRVSKIDQTFKR